MISPVRTISENSWLSWTRAALESLSADANNKIFADPARGLIDAVKLENLLHGLGHVGHDLEEVKVFCVDVSKLEKVLGQKRHPGLPIGATGPVEQDHWNDPRLSRLHEGQRLESFIHRAETAGEKRKGMGFFHKVEFAGEEVVEVDELRVASMMTFACCSKGRRMLRPKLCSRPAPRWAAPMMPSPAPVMTM